MELHLALRDLVERTGPKVFDELATVRGVLDDVLSDDQATAGDLNLLADAVRLGAIAHLVRITDAGADPRMAVETVGVQLANNRGGADVSASIWACAVLGYALGLVPEQVVRRWRTPPRPSVEVPGLGPAGFTAAPVTRPAVSAAPTTSAPDLRADEPLKDSAPRPRAPFLWAAVVLVVAALVGAVSAVAVTNMGGADAPGATVATDPTSEQPGRTGQTGQEGPDSAKDPSASAAAPGTAAHQQGTVACWNGTDVAALPLCSLPDGVPGLEWVFPGSGAVGCGGVARGHHGRVVDRYCTLGLPSGAEAQVHYSQWRDFDQMRLNYREDQVGPDLELDRDDLHGFAVADPDAEEKIVLYYRLPDAPWAVTIYAGSDAEIDSALRVLQVRPVKQLRGVGRQQQHLSVSFRVVTDPAA